MTFYQAQFILTELLTITMILHVFNYKGFTRRQKGWFIHTFLTILLCSAAEFLVHGVPYHPPMKVFLTVITVLQFSFAPILGVLFSGALGMEKQQKAAKIFLAFNLVVETALAPSGQIFSFTDEGYVRGPLFIIYGICFLFGILYLIVNLIRVGRKFRHRDFATIGMVVVVLIAGIIPMTLYKINISYR